MLIHNTNFYQDITQLSSLISNLEFHESFYGYEVKDFRHLPAGIEDHVCAAVNNKVIITKNSGSFRKPYPIIHFENFTEKMQLVLVVALEQTTFSTYEHESGASNVFHVTDLNEFMKSELVSEKWKQTAKIILKPNDFIVFNPWVWHSFDEKLIQVFYLETPDAI